MPTRPPVTTTAPDAPARRDARALALHALVRIDTEGAYANLLLPQLLDRSGLDVRDRGFVTELVYGTTRMRRACDFLVDRFLSSDPGPPTRQILRLGAYQLAFTRVKPHAAVDATVVLAAKRHRGLVNAVLRKVASSNPGTTNWPDEATRLSYPDWIVHRLVAELGEADAIGALAQMDEAPTSTEREDGYVQDTASQWVAGLVPAAEGETVADLCAAPGGKSTWLAGHGLRVVASDLQPHRARLIASNVRRLRQAVPVVVADAAAPPYRPASFDHVLVDAPCSGLGSLRRRPDARWRITEDDIARLAVLQSRILRSAAALVRPGGTLTYAVCTLTNAESVDLDPVGWDALPPPGDPWVPVGRGARLLPQASGTDGMTVLRYRIHGQEGASAFGQEADGTDMGKRSLADG
jgi:16S rRNA (cytosine967-C5)-methyltransferase